MAHLGILTSQKNDILSALENVGFNAKDFSLSDHKDFTLVEYKDVKFYCAIRVTSNHFHNNIETVPGDKTLKQSYFPKSDKWSDYLPTIKLWAERLKLETMTIDRWQELRSNAEKTVLIDFKSNDNFKEEEKQIIRERIKLIQTNIGKIGLESEKQKSIENKLDELSSKLDSLNKTNWFELFTGAIVGQVLSLSISQSTANQIWEIIKSAFSSYFQIGA
jgi:hypothetical protein